MPIEAELENSKSRPPRRLSHHARRAGYYLFFLLLGYFLFAYIAAPMIWSGYERYHPALKDAEEITHTADKHPGDPINIAIVGSVEDLKSAMQTAGWRKADPLGFRSDASIA